MRKFTKRAWQIVRIITLVGLLCLTGILIWAATLQLPTLDNFEQRRAIQSTKIYDRTGENVLFDFNEDVRRTVVELDEISENLQLATIAIEDDKFYSHAGVRPMAILRALIANVQEGGISQGGSTITQQVVKNALLTREKSYTRKIKEAILAIRLERQFSKDEILALYLNDSPYGGVIYGAEEASQSFFDKPASELTLAEAAYLAALPQAPTLYSPYGDHIELLESRKDRVLQNMFNLGYINDGQLSSARAEEVTFQPRGEQGIEAPHFVFYVRSLLEKELGTDAVENGGLTVISTLDLELQNKAQEIVKRYAERNLQQFNAENAAAVAIEAETGQIIVMVGSRDWFDDSFDGKVNAATSLRQPGSTFKPFIYATAFEKGYTPETVVFDLPTQFNVNCPANQLNNDNGCYAPVNYDDEFLGPITFRNALAQSRNIPAVKAFYLAGLRASAQTATNMGISTLDDVDRYGLTLVLGGGEVTLVDLTSAYTGFANDGRRVPHTPILKVTDSSGDVIMEYQESQDERVIDRQVARQITHVLTDNVARTPAFGPNSLLNITTADVASKTGTTNDYRDAWTVGYTPEIAVGAWAGNNDATPMEKKTAGFIITPIWHEVMQLMIEAGYGDKQFRDPEFNYEGLKPILRGQWETNGPDSIHSILAFVDKDNPTGPIPANPSADPQFNNWESAVRNWVNRSYGGSIVVNDPDKPDNGSTGLDFSISGIRDYYDVDDRMSIRLNSSELIENAVIFINGTLVTNTSDPNGVDRVSFDLSGFVYPESNNTVTVLVTTPSGQVGEISQSFETK